MKTFLERPIHLLAFAAGLLCAAPAALAQDITLKMWTLDNPGYPEFIAQAAEAFKKTHPGVTIEHQTFPGDAYKTSLPVALVGSDAPDVFFNWSGDAAKRLVRDGLALDITAAAMAKGGFATELGEGLLDAFRYDGKLYGAAADAVSKYVFYNKDYFAANNIALPKTMSELAGVCKAVRAIDPDTVAMPLGNKTRWKAIHWMTMLNERVMGVDGTAADYDLSRPADALFTDPGYAKAFGELIKLQDAGCFEEAPNATEYTVADAMFATQASPMEFCGTWCTAGLDAAGFTNYGFFRLPLVEGGKGDAGANFLVPEGFQVSSKTQHAKEAVEWISFLVSPEQGAKFAELTKFLPSNPKMIDSVASATPQFKEIVADMGTFTRGVNVLDVLLEASVADAYLNATVEVLNRTVTPADAVAQIRQTALAAQAKLPAK
ncbi:carbohydrate ABC transporter substrate-binding protein (CUT1 family) [Rhizobium sp. PP-F2F-G20b]|nr:carbohydrate ABC transporter substrate-binding protein (CUT1 family) [Rhizobium sp. PP-F2F-G20b]